MKEILAIGTRPPEPKGVVGDQAAFDLLSRLGKGSAISFFASSPPASSQILKAEFAARGIRINQPFVPKADMIEAQIKSSVRGRHYQAIVLLGAPAIERWMRPLRMFVPHIPLIACFADGAELPFMEGRFSAVQRSGLRSSWGNLLSLADAVWIPTRESHERFRRWAFLSKESLLEFSGARVESPEWLERYFSALSVRRRPRRRSVLIAASSDALSEKMSKAAAGAVRVEMPRRVQGPGGAVAQMNRTIAASRFEYLWAALHPFEPTESLFRALFDGMELLGYAGAAAPASADGAPTLGVNGRLFSALWEMNSKGRWEEVTAPTHSCCVLLRRQAWEKVGRLDERFEDPLAAWTDFFLRLQLAGLPVFRALDALAFCRHAKGAQASLLPGLCEEDRDLLVEKWCKGSLHFMESLLNSLEPEGYRSRGGRPVRRRDS